MTDRDLDQAGILDPRLRKVYTAGADLFRAYAGGHFVARLLFPAPKRPYLETFWSFVLHVDGIVDNERADVEVRARRLDEWVRMFDAVLEGGPVPEITSEDQVEDLNLARAFVHTIRTWNLPSDHVRDHLDGQRAALTTTQYATEADFADYVEKVVLMPAVLVNRIFEGAGPESVEQCRQTITGFHRLDCLWDLKQDMALGRLYLPLDHLAKFDLDRPALEAQVSAGRLSTSLRDLIRFEIERARTHLARGRDWLKTVHPTSRQFLELDMGRFDAIADKLAEDDLAYFRGQRQRDDYFTSSMMARMWTAMSKAELVNQAALRDGYRVPDPAEATWDQV
nr:squalene/phytoene synthase family protein [Kibdelosporangium sp. MJ126-NF4]CEL13397.1 Phytoene synthase [Kibdelosporangium sp. MJ126-NF4]CTQ99086.1 Phytoene synthase (EC 2.5.1.32) [Kibdelosporangium sp. MJ126-NF4]